MKQLLNTRDDYNCDLMNLIIVIVNEAGVALNNREDYLEVLKDVKRRCDDTILTFSVVAGRVDYFSGIPDD